VTTAPDGAVTYGNVYNQLLEYIIPADLVFYGLMVGAVIIMRRKAPHAPRPYRTFGYPIVPVVYILLATLLILDLVWLAPLTSGKGVLIVLTGFPVYLIWRRNAVIRSAVETETGD
jgi:APA family basic amino acid/polyamine antiporter